MNDDVWYVQLSHLDPRFPQGWRTLALSFTDPALAEEFKDMSAHAPVVPPVPSHHPVWRVISGAGLLKAEGTEALNEAQGAIARHIARPEDLRPLNP